MDSTRFDRLVLSGEILVEGSSCVCRCGCASTTFAVDADGELSNTPVLELIMQCAGLRLSSFDVQKHTCATCLIPNCFQHLVPLCKCDSFLKKAPAFGSRSEVFEFLHKRSDKAFAAHVMDLIDDDFIIITPKIGFFTCACGCHGASPSSMNFDDKFHSVIFCAEKRKRAGRLPSWHDCSTCNSFGCALHAPPRCSCRVNHNIALDRQRKLSLAGF